jgi:hypothetical protein
MISLESRVEGREESSSLQVYETLFLSFTHRLADSETCGLADLWTRGLADSETCGLGDLWTRGLTYPLPAQGFFHSIN